MNTLKLRPVNGAIIVKRVSNPQLSEEQTPGGIIIPDTVYKDPSSFAEVVDFDPEGQFKNGKATGAVISKGSIVMFSRFAATMRETHIKDDHDCELFTMQPEHIIAIVEQ